MFLPGVDDAHAAFATVCCEAESPEDVRFGDRSVISLLNLGWLDDEHHHHIDYQRMKVASSLESESMSGCYLTEYFSVFTDKIICFILENHYE